MIKAILVFGLLAFTTLELRGKTTASHLAVRRVVAILILLLGVTGIVFPDLVSKLANLVGVGRGADLVLYALVIAFLFSTLGLYQRLSKLEERYVTLSRQLAIARALGEPELSGMGDAPAGELPPLRQHPADTGA
ncbi:MAG: DUF2304 domain-containing protein [Nocardioidaceae bacterium]